MESKYQKKIADGLKKLRKERGLAQAQLAAELKLSQPRYSQIERGQGSISAEQFLTILSKYNLSIDYFIKDKKRNSEDLLQNSLARLGAKTLREKTNILPSDKLIEVNQIIYETLLTSKSSRLILALVPVVLKNFGQIQFYKIADKLNQLGLGRRLWWLLEGCEKALSQSKKQSSTCFEVAQRIRLLNKPLVSKKNKEIKDDLLDADITSIKTLNKIKKSRDPLAQKWHIITRITQTDFLNALEDNLDD